MRDEQRTLLMRLGITVATAARTAQAKEFDLDWVMKTVQALTEEPPDPMDDTEPPKELVEGDWAAKWAAGEEEAEDEEEPSIPGIT